MVVDFVQLALREGTLAEEAMWQVVVLIPKETTDYQGIGLVEMMWNVVAAILNRRLTASITFHAFLHGGASRWLIWEGLQGGNRGNTGRSAFPHHI